MPSMFALSEVEGLDKAFKGEMWKDLTGFHDTFPGLRQCPGVGYV